MTLGAQLLPAIRALAEQVAAVSSAPARAAAGDLAAQVAALADLRAGLGARIETVTDVQLDLAVRAGRLAQVLADIGVAQASPVPGPVEALGPVLAAISADAVVVAAAADALGLDRVALATSADTQDAALAQVAAALADLRARAAALDAPPPVAKPYGARSGLPWASCWRHPSATTTVVQPAFLSFETFRGRKLDGLHVFMQGWKNHPLARWPANSLATAKGTAPGGAGEGVLWWLGRDGIDAYLTWPLISDTGVPDGKARFQAVVDGAYDAAHSAVADQVLATGANIRVIRVGHEASMGDPVAGIANYPWCVAYAEGDYPLFRAAYAHVANLLQAKFPNALLDFNCQRILRNVSSLDDIFPGAPFKIISGEGYGADDAISTSTGLQAFLSQGTPDFPMGAYSWVAAARKRGCFGSVPEWSTAVLAGKAITRDIGDFVRAMYEHFVRNSDVLAWEAQFGTDNLTGTGLHSFWAPVSCPNASAAYAECWRTRWQAPS